MAESVVIFGTYGAGIACDTRRDLECVPEDAERWVVNTPFGLDFDPDRIYQIHERYDKLCAVHPAYEQSLGLYEKSGAELVVWHEGCPRLEGGRRFDMEKASGTVPLEVFTSSFSYAVVDALMEGFKTIFVRRCRLSNWDEYQEQAHALLWLRKFAADRFGAVIDLPYAWDWETRFEDGGTGSLPRLAAGKPYGSLLKEVSFLGLAALHMQGTTEENLHGSCAEVWSLNDYWRHYPDIGIDRLFQVHRSYDGTHAVDRKRDDSAWAEKTEAAGCPVMVSPGAHKQLSRRMEMDLQRMADEFGAHNMTSSIAFMLAQAILEGFEKVNFFAVHLMTRGEYVKQQSGVLALIDIARSRGIVVNAPHEPLWREAEERRRANPLLSAKGISVMYGQAPCRRLDIGHGCVPQDITLYGQD